jgi:hypothetical protein
MTTVPTTWQWDDGQPNFGVQLGAIAVANLDGTIGTPIRIPSLKTTMVSMKTVTDQAQGDMSITAIAAQLISADLTLDTAGISRAVYTTLTGVQPTSSSTPTRTYTTYGNDRFPYFALIIESLAAEASGDTLIFLPKVKLTQGFDYKFEFGKITTPQLKATAIKDLVLGYTMQKVDRATIASITMPPS